MSFIERHKLHFMLFDSWKNKKDPDEVEEIINERFSKVPSNSKDVQDWFNLFNEGDISIFDVSSLLKVSIHSNSNGSLNHLLYMHDDKKVYNCFINNDRFMLATFYSSLNGYSLFFYDLFRNVKK